MIKRYDIEKTGDEVYPFDLKKSYCGDLVKYDDHIAELEAVKNRACECTWYIHSADEYCPKCGGKIEIKE